MIVRRVGHEARTVFYIVEIDFNSLACKYRWFRGVSFPRALTLRRERLGFHKLLVEKDRVSQRRVYRALSRDDHQPRFLFVRKRSIEMDVLVDPVEKRRVSAKRGIVFAPDAFHL